MGMHGGFFHRAGEEKDQYRLRELDQKVVRMFLRYIQPYRRTLFFTLAMMIIMAAMNMAAPYLSKLAVDEYIAKGNMQGLNLILLGYAGTYGIYWVASYQGSYASRLLGQRVIADMRKDLYAHVSSLSLDFFGERQTGSIMSRLTNDVNTMLEFISDGIVSLVSGLVTIIGVLIIMYLLSPSLTYIVLLTIPIIFGGTWVMGRYMRNAYGQVRQKVGALNAGVEENLSGIRVVKSMSQEASNEGSFEKLNRENLAAHVKAVAITALFFPFMSVTSSLGTAFVVLAGGMLVIRGQATVGLILAFLGYINRMFMPLRELSQIYSVYQSAAASADRIYRYFQKEPLIREPQDPVQIQEPIAGRIDFDHVTFGYNPERPVLHDIHFAIPAGQTTAVVGATGAGKSTLIKLLARLYDPQTGDVCIDGHPVNKISLAALRRMVMVVPQEVFLFTGTIRDNIRYGRLDAFDSEVYQAAASANADSFITQLPAQYDTEVGEGGMLLSGGQRQLIAFARAILADRPILVLDEATSSVDAATEVLIQKALDQLLIGRTSIIIAHRFTTLRRAEQIAVMEDGRLVAYNTHENLLKTSPLYRSLYEKQWKSS